MSALRLREHAVAWREVGDEVIALELGTSSYLGTNPAGTLLWTRLARGTTREEMTSTLAAEFGIDEASAREDVDAFVRQVESRGLLEA